MNIRILLATLAVFALGPAAAWAQGYGGSSPPPDPRAIPAGPQSVAASAALPQAQQPGGQYPADWHVPSAATANSAPVLAAAQTYPAPYPGTSAPPQSVYALPAGMYAAQQGYPPAGVAPNGPIYATGPSADVPMFPTTALPSADSHWMFSAEAIWLERVDYNTVILGNTVTDYGSGLGYVTDILTSTDVAFPLDSGVRLQAGYRFNEGNSLEMTYFGLQQVSVGRTIYGDPVGNTVLAYSPWTQTDALIGGFDNSLGYTYGSRVNNAEINQRIVAGAGPSWNLAGLWGVRFVQVADRFNLNGSDLSTGDFENLDIRTTNNLLGPQIGVAWSSYLNRLELTSELKGALLANFSSASFSNLNSSGVISGNPAGFYAVDQSARSTNVAGLLELSLLARYHVAEHLWIRGGYQTYFLSGLALGPRQLASFNHTGGLTLDGPSLGLETNW